MVVYKFINRQDIPPPEKLDTTKIYTTRVENCYWDGKHFVIELEWLGEEMTDENRCLFPVNVN